MQSNTLKNREIQINLVIEQQRSAAWSAEKKEKELKNIQRDNMLKQNEMQLNIKKDKEKAEKEKDSVLVKTVSN